MAAATAGGAVFFSLHDAVIVLQKPPEVNLFLYSFWSTLSIMKKKHPGGRPTLAPEDRASVKLQFRVTPADAELIQQAAEGQPYGGVSAWIRERVLRAARRELR